MHVVRETGRVAVVEGQTECEVESDVRLRAFSVRLCDCILCVSIPIYCPEILTIDGFRLTVLHLVRKDATDESGLSLAPDKNSGGARYTLLVE